MKYVCSILILLLSACAQTIQVEELHHLNGYWQIEQVTFPDKSAKTYELSSTLDFIQLEEGKGFRKKVQPALDGTFDTSDDAITFEVVPRNDDVYLIYSNAVESWEELLLSVDSVRFSVRNEAGIIYEYRRYEPVMMEDEQTL